MRRKIALTISGLLTVAALAPLPSASASCTDLSRIGGPECASFCPGILLELTDEYVNDGFLRCTM